MVLTINILAISALIITAVQDFRRREIHWSLFPILLCLFIGEGILSAPAREYFQGTLFNLIFLSIQALVLIIYYLLRRKSLRTIINGSLGLGDILFLLVTAFSLSDLNFIVFYMLGLTITLLTWLIIKPFLSINRDTIPLAGFLSVMLAIVLIFENLPFGFNCFNNFFLSELIYG